MESSDYFSIKNFNLYIPCDTTDFSNIISYNCNEAIEGFIILDNYAKLTISLSFKILYTTKESTSLKILTHKTYCYDVIKLPAKIDGFNLHKLNTKKKLFPLCNIHSISLICYMPHYITLSALMVNTVEVIRSLSVVYKISENDGFNNLYASDIFCNNFTQLTFNPKSYDNICFAKHTDDIFYNNNNAVYCYSLDTKSIKNLFTYDSLHWFYNIEPNKFIICRYIDDNYCIILLNTINNNENLIYKSYKNILCSSFNFSNNFLSFIEFDDTNKYLITLNTCDNSLTKLDYNCDRVFINPCHKFALGVNDNNLIIVDILSKTHKKFPIPIDNFILNTLIFISSDTSIILGTSNNFNYIISFNFKDLSFIELLKVNFTISSLDINNEGTMFLSSNELGLFNIYKFRPGYEPKLILKLFANNISLLVRK